MNIHYAAAVLDVQNATREFNNARQWLSRNNIERLPLAADVWVFDASLTQILLVEHRWRGWVAPGGTVETGETPLQAAKRELAEETGVTAHLRPEPSAVTVRSYRAGWDPTLGLTYSTVIDLTTALTPEPGQPARWHRLDHQWRSVSPEDRQRMAWYADWLRQHTSPERSAHKTKRPTGNSDGAPAASRRQTE